MKPDLQVPLSELRPQRIVLVKPSSLGDIVHSLPVLTALRRRFPEARITWVVARGYEPLLAGHPDLNATCSFDRRMRRSGIGKALLEYSRFARDVRRQAADLAVDLQGLFRSGLMTGLTGAPRRIGLSTAREAAAYFYTDVVPVPNADRLHAVDRYWLVARALGAGEVPKCFRVPISEDADRWAEELLSPYPRPFLVLGVGSRWPTKRWPPDHFGRLARWSQDRFSGTVVFVGSEEEARLAQTARRYLTGKTCDLTGRTTLPQLAAILARATVMVANDTGPLHLAAALGRPVVAPYTCTTVAENGPYGPRAHGVETRVWCAGSYLKRCSRMECMSELTPDRLWPVLEGILQAWESERRSA